MTHVRPPDPEARACAKRLIALIQLLLTTRPEVLLELERQARQAVDDDVRRQVVERMQLLNAENVRAVEALTAHLLQEQNGDFRLDLSRGYDGDLPDDLLDDEP